MKWLITSAVLMIAGGMFLLYGGGIPGPSPDPCPTPAPFSDMASKTFADTEAAWRSLQGEKAAKLRAGALKSEAEAKDWFQVNYTTKFKEAWTPLLNAEYEAFGGENWTAEKEAAVAERYVQ